MRSLAALACTLVLFLSACGAGTDSAPTTAAADNEPSPTAGGTSAPAVLDFQSETVAGEPFNGRELAGKPTVFWFWAPWCPTCRAQISGVGELAATYGSDINVVGIGAHDERAAIEEFASDVSTDVTLLADPDGAAWRHLGITAQSTYLVLDEDGTELARGYLDDPELVATVDSLVG